MSPSELEKLSESKSLIRIVDSLLYFALRERASDIHLEPQESETRMRYRIDGRLREMLRFPKILHRPIMCRIMIMCDLNIARLPGRAGWTLSPFSSARAKLIFA